MVGSDFSHEWSLGALEGPHSFRVEAQKGRYVATRTTTLMLYKPVNVTTPLQKYETHAKFNASGEAHHYVFTHDPACGPNFYLTARGPQGSDVDLYVNQGDQSGSDPLDPTWYDEQRSGPSNAEYVRWTGAVPGIRYNVLVKLESASPVPYRLILEVPPEAAASCSYGAVSGTESPTELDMKGESPHLDPDP